MSRQLSGTHAELSSRRLGTIVCVSAAEDLSDAQVRKQRVVDVFDRGAPEYDQLGVDFFTPACP